jgi:ABC-2 type transport system permease protein
VVLPASSYGAAGGALQVLPSAALGTGMRTALLDGGFAGVPALVLALWAIIGGVLTSRTFTWE